MTAVDHERTDTLPDSFPDGEEELVRGGGLRLAMLLLGLVALTVLGGVSVLVFVVALVVMITLHELGHYLTARWAGMKVTEFFIGFGPRIWAIRRGETIYGIKAIPAGAYVKIIGMHNLEDVDPADEGRTYRQKPFWRRLSVAVAGSTMHFLIALILLFILLAGIGLPGGSALPDADDLAPEDWQVSFVAAGSAAAKAGIEQGDRITAIDGIAISTFEELGNIVRPRPGRTVDVEFERDASLETRPVTLGTRLPRNTEQAYEPRTGLLGITQEPKAIRLGPVAAARGAITDFSSITWQSTTALFRVFSPTGIGSFVGQVRDAQEPVSAAPTTGGGGEGEANPEDYRLISIYGATRIGADMVERGWVPALFFLVLMNIFIGVFNLVPLLPLDGGHVAIAVYEKLREVFARDNRRYFVDVGKLLPLTYAVILVLVGLGLSSLYLDIVNPIPI